MPYHQPDQVRSGYASVHEDFISLYSPSISADTLIVAIKDCLYNALIFLFQRCVASAMMVHQKGSCLANSGCRKQAVFIHCYGHALNLACGDAMKGCKILKSALETTQELTKLVKFSPKQKILFKEKKQEVAPDTPGI